MNNYYNYALKLRWNETLFYLVLPKSALNLYALTRQISAKDENDYDVFNWVCCYNLALDVFNHLKRIFQPLEIVEILKHSNYNYEVIENMQIDLDSSFVIDVAIAGNSNQIQELLIIYESSKLQLEKLHPFQHEVNFTYGTKEFKLFLSEAFYKQCYNLPYIKLSLLINHRPEQIFVAKSIFSYLYNMYYPDFIPFVFDKYYLELVVNLLNIMLCKIKPDNIAITSWGMEAKLPVDQYLKLIVRQGDFNSHILFKDHDSPLLDLLNKYDLHGNKNEEPGDFVHTTINCPVISHCFATTLEQIKELKNGDILLSLDKVNQELPILTIELGDRLILAEETNGRLVIKGIKD